MNYGARFIVYLPEMRHQLWRQNAACIGMPELFQAGMGSDEAREMSSIAVQLCHRCPVIQECGDWHARERKHLPLVGVYAGRIWVTPSTGSRRLVKEAECA